MRVLSNKFFHTLREEAGGDGEGSGGGEGGFSAMLAGLPEEFRSENVSILEGVKDFDGLMKSYVNGQRLIGKSIRIPDEDADEETLKGFYGKLNGVKGVAINNGDDAAFRKSIGVPDDADGYRIDLSSLPSDFSPDGGEFEALKKEALDLGLTNEQAQKRIAGHFKAQTEALGEWNVQIKQLESNLKQEFGNAYDQKMGMAQFAMNDVFGQDLGETIRAVPELLLSPEFNKAMARVGELLQDDGSLTQARKAQLNLTPEEAQMKIGELRAHPAYADSRNPEHKSIVKKLEQAYQAAYPN